MRFRCGKPDTTAITHIPRRGAPRARSSAGSSRASYFCRYSIYELSKPCLDRRKEHVRTPKNVPCASESLLRLDPAALKAVALHHATMAAHAAPARASGERHRARWPISAIWCRSARFREMAICRRRGAAASYGTVKSVRLRAQYRRKAARWPGAANRDYGLRHAGGQTPRIARASAWQPTPWPRIVAGKSGGHR